MNVFVKDEKCIGCGSCVSLTDGKVFDFNDEGKVCVNVEKIDEKDIELVEKAIEYCPTAAIVDANKNLEIEKDAA